MNDSSMIYWVQSPFSHLLNKDIDAYFRDIVRPT